MNEFRFQVLEWRISEPQEWLRVWADRYDRDISQDDREGYEFLINNRGSRSPDYFVRMGQWKDNAFNRPNKWRRNVASVAHEVWMIAATELPNCPEEDNVIGLLECWSKKAYIDQYPNGQNPNGQIRKQFGLSRATTMLHFLSGGRYPILDSRVRKAISRLRGRSVPSATPKKYVEFYCPVISKVAAACGVQNNLRLLDKALFSYGAARDYSALM